MLHKTQKNVSVTIPELFVHCKVWMGRQTWIYHLHIMLTVLVLSPKKQMCKIYQGWMNESWVVNVSFRVKDCLKISLLMLSEFKQINQLLLPLKSSKNQWFKSQQTPLNSFNIKSDICWRSLKSSLHWAQSQLWVKL